MPQYNRTEMERIARSLGFARDTFEKVFRLRKILSFFNSENILKSHFLLKGGTAINLTIFDMPRLSVDIDMDFVPNLTPDEMTRLRKQSTETILKYMESEGYELSSASYSHYSLDSFHFNYINSGGGRDILKIELNYSLRAHLFPSKNRIIARSFFPDHVVVQCADEMEIFSAKAAALLTRAAARDLYDFCNMIESDLFRDNRDLFRKCIIFYASISTDEIDEEFHTDSIDSITKQMIRRDLMPVLKQPERSSPFDLLQKVSTAKEYIRSLMILTENEKDYIRCFRNREYKPELLFTEDTILERIKTHPMALWKCQ